MFLPISYILLLPCWDNDKNIWFEMSQILGHSTLGVQAVNKSDNTSVQLLSAKRLRKLKHAQTLNDDMELLYILQFLKILLIFANCRRWHLYHSWSWMKRLQRTDYKLWTKILRLHFQLYMPRISLTLVSN